MNVRSPFYVFIGDSDLQTSAADSSVAFDCTKAALSGQIITQAGLIIPATSNLTTVTVVTSNFPAVSTVTSRIVTYNVLIPAGYSNTGDGTQTIQCTVTTNQPATLSTSQKAAATFTCQDFKDLITTPFAVSSAGAITFPVATGVTILNHSQASFPENRTGVIIPRKLGVQFTVPSGYANTGSTLTIQDGGTSPCDALIANQDFIVDPNTYYRLFPCQVSAGQSISPIIGFSTNNSLASGSAYSINGVCYNIAASSVTDTTIPVDTTHNLGSSAQYGDCDACNSAGVGVVPTNVFFKLQVISNGVCSGNFVQTAAISNQSFAVNERVQESGGSTQYVVMEAKTTTYSLTEKTVVSVGKNLGCPTVTQTTFYQMFAVGSIGNTVNSIGYDLGTYYIGQTVFDTNNNEYVIIGETSSDPGGNKITLT